MCVCWVIVSLESFPARFVCVKARDTIVGYAPGSAKDAPNPLPPSQMLLLARAKQMYKSTPLPDSTKTLDNKLSSNRSVAARLGKLFICKTAAYSSKARLVCFGSPGRGEGGVEMYFHRITETIVFLRVSVVRAFV